MLLQVDCRPRDDTLAFGLQGWHCCLGMHITCMTTCSWEPEPVQEWNEYGQEWIACELTWIPMTMTLLWNWGNAWKCNNLKAVYPYPTQCYPGCDTPATWDDHLQVVKRIHGEDGAQERLAPSSKRFVGLPQKWPSKCKSRHRLVETIHFPYNYQALR